MPTSASFSTIAILMVMISEPSIPFRSPTASGLAPHLPISKLKTGGFAFGRLSGGSFTFCYLESNGLFASGQIPYTAVLLFVFMPVIRHEIYAFV
jgi:hypothetical protein